MAIAHLSRQDLREFQEGWKRDPATTKLNELEIAHVTRKGGLTLQIWRLHRGIIFGEPIMMSSDEVAKKLGLPLSKVDGLITQVHEAVRPLWRETPEWQDSPFEKKHRTGSWAARR